MQPQWVILCMAFPTILIPIWIITTRFEKARMKSQIPHLTPTMQARLRRQATAYLRRAKKRPERVDWQTEGF
jgi:hypothetical protein